MIQIDSPRYGSLNVEPSRVIQFPGGLAGFEDCTKFTLFHPEEDNPRYFILQSLDDPTVAFHIADPDLFGFNYELNLSDDEAATLQLKDPNDLVVVVILSKESGGTPVRANLNSPLVINTLARRGLQHVFSSLNYNVSHKE